MPAMEYLGHCLFVLNWAFSIASRRKTGDEYPPVFIFFKELLFPRVDWLVTKQLSAQGRPDPRGELHCFFGV
jgi:hypothetical protein